MNSDGFVIPSMKAKYVSIVKTICYLFLEVHPTIYIYPFTYIFTYSN